MIQSHYCRALLKAVPISTQMRIILLMSSMYGRLAPIPEHLRRNFEFALGHEACSKSDFDNISRNFLGYKKRLRLIKPLGRFWEFNDKERFAVEGREHLDSSLALGRGVILATAHLGYPSLIGPILRCRGYEVQRVIAEGRLKNRQKCDQSATRDTEVHHHASTRTRTERDSIENHEIAANLDVRPIFAALSRNRSVIIAGEGMRSVAFAKLPLLGRPYPFPIGFMKIAIMTGASVLPAFAVDGKGRAGIRVQIKPPLEIDPDEEVVANLQKFARALEAQILRTPHLWIRWNVERLFQVAEEWAEADVRERYSGDWRKHRA